ncbi:hypothetical protein GOP47_0003327 [Adiantum capillus-veneris]|uniref:Flowering-promoting factor 1-like protein 3 n=1 Tax=Adiantum capillus-veneris TaxID=13818 RepID=A0A9D4VCK5_ADICA|nr:hypothetical protein GOP47_0003327 [Adiantum capillus-veneris]
MAGVWVFKNGVAKLVQNPMVEPIDGGQEWQQGRRKALVFLPTSEVICSYSDLEEKLQSLGWERYYAPDCDDSEMLQYHRCYSSSLLISLPSDFRKFKTMHMYDIVLKNREYFEVRDL